MTNEMRARVEKAVVMANDTLTIEAAKAAIAQNEKKIAYWNSLPSWKIGFTGKTAIANAQNEIAYFEAVIEVLTEQIAAEAVTETVAVLAAIVTVTNKAQAVLRAVATLANKLRKLNYSLSDAFKKAWTLTKAFAGLLPSFS